MSTTTNSTTAAATNKATELLLKVMLQRTRGKVTRDSNYALVKQLLTAGGDVNGKDSQGFPPLTIMAWRGHTEEAQLILKHKRRRELNKRTEKWRQGRTSTGSPGICT